MMTHSSTMEERPNTRSTNWTIENPMKTKMLYIRFMTGKTNAKSETDGVQTTCHIPMIIRRFYLTLSSAKGPCITLPLLNNLAN